MTLRDRHIEVTDKGGRGHSSPGLAAHAGCCTLERAASTPECTRPGARCTVVAKRVKRATTPTGAQGFGGEGELSRNGRQLNGPVWENRRACEGTSN